MQVQEHPQHIQILVTVGQKPPLKLTFETDAASGLAIKQKAGYGVSDGLYEKEHGDAVEIADDATVALKNGMQFVIIPNGRVS